jgi:predicted nucleic acid-binding protein
MIVLDASALVDVVTDQPTKPGVLEHLAQPLSAPGHQLAEVVSALARMARAGVLDPADAEQALLDAASLKQAHVPLDAELLGRALALDGRLRVLAALYVALAERLSCPLLTTDARLARADPPCEVVLVAAD